MKIEKSLLNSLAIFAPDLISCSHVTILDLLHAQSLSRLLLKTGNIDHAPNTWFTTQLPNHSARITGRGQVTYDGIGKVNASPPRHIGEFEFHDPHALVDYLAMPKRLRNIEEKVDRVLKDSQ